MNRKVSLSSEDLSGISMNLLSPIKEKPEWNEQTARLSMSMDETIIKRTDRDKKRSERSKREPRSKSDE